MIYRRQWFPNKRPRRVPVSTRWKVLLPLIACTFLYSYSQAGKHEVVERAPQRRHLLSTASWERCNFEIGHERNYSDSSSNWDIPEKFQSAAYGYLTMHVVFILIVFVGIAVICDDFFVPSLEAISEALNLSEDVAGATFMAAGSSAPELFTSIAGVTVESDVGVGTIVGSAVFNLLCICALSAVFADKALELDWRPLCRDATFYGLSIACFIGFSWDGKFDIWESVIMLLLYVLYIIIMKFNRHLMRFLHKLEKKNKLTPTPENQPAQLTDIGQAPPAPEEHGDGKRFSRADKGFGGSKISLTNSRAGSATKISMPKIPGSETNGAANGVITSENTAQGSSTEANESDEEEERTCKLLCMPAVIIDTPEMSENPCCDCWGKFKFGFSWVVYIVAFPFIVMFTYTIPDCSTEKTKKWYPLSFIMSIIWIAILSFAIVTLVGRAGCILGIDKFTMGLVVVAIGTSLPDAMSSILVAKDGYGDMAVSNAIGSNVFDIDLGVGLPFVISSIIKGGKSVVLISEENQEYIGWKKNSYPPMLQHPKFGVILLVLLFLALGIFGAVKFRLTKRLALSFVLMYIAFLCYAFIQELVCNQWGTGDAFFC